MEQQLVRGIPEYVYGRFESVQSYMIWYLWWKSFQSWDTFMISVSTETGENTRNKVAATQTAYMQRMYTLLVPLLQQPASNTVSMYAQILTTLYECTWLVYTRGKLGYNKLEAIHQVAHEFGTFADNIYLSQNIQHMETELLQKYRIRVGSFPPTQTDSGENVDNNNNNKMQLHAQRAFVLGTIFFVALTQQGSSEKLKRFSVDLFQSVASTIRHEHFVETDVVRQLYETQIQQALWIPTERTYNNHLLLFPDLDKQWRIDAGLVVLPVSTLQPGTNLVEKSMDNIKSDMEEITNLMQTTQVKLMKASAGREIKKSKRRGIQAIISEDGLGTVELLSTKVVPGSLATDSPKIITTPLAASPRHARAFSSAASIPTSPKKAQSSSSPRDTRKPMGQLAQTVNEQPPDQKKNGWIIASPRKSNSMPNLPAILFEPLQGAVIVAKRQQFISTVTHNPLSLYAYCSTFVHMVSAHLVKSHESIHTAGMWTFLAQTVGNPNCAFKPAAPVWDIHKTMYAILSTVLPMVLLIDIGIVDLLVNLADNLVVHPLYMERITTASKNLIPQWFLYMQTTTTTTTTTQKKAVSSTLWVDTEKSNTLCQTISYLELFTTEFAQKEMEWTENEAAMDPASIPLILESKKFHACVEECKKVHTEAVHTLYNLLQTTTSTRLSKTTPTPDTDNDESESTTTSSSGKL